MTASPELLAMLRALAADPSDFNLGQLRDWLEETGHSKATWYGTLRFGFDPRTRLWMLGVPVFADRDNLDNPFCHWHDLAEREPTARRLLVRRVVETLGFGLWDVAQKCDSPIHQDGEKYSDHWCPVCFGLGWAPLVPQHRDQVAHAIPGEVRRP